MPISDLFPKTVRGRRSASIWDSLRCEDVSLSGCRPERVGNFFYCEIAADGEAKDTGNPFIIASN